MAKFDLYYQQPPWKRFAPGGYITLFYSYYYFQEEMDFKEGFSDTELVHALQRDGRVQDEAIRFIYLRYYGGLTQFVLSNGGNEQDADDIFQEAVVSFVEMVKLGKYRQEASVKTIMYTINRNIWYTEVTKRGKRDTRNKLFVAEHYETEQNVADYITGREARATIMKVMEKLGEGCKKILLLYYYENLSMKEIQEQTHFESEQVVRNKKYKCLKQLEQMMQENPVIYNELKNALSNER
jgi:RNA polymerase sigma factor (sigma-70 family)